MMLLTCGIGELILLALYPIFERLCIPSSDLYLLLDRLRARVRHADRLDHWWGSICDTSPVSVMLL